MGTQISIHDVTNVSFESVEYVNEPGCPKHHRTRIKISTRDSEFTIVLFSDHKEQLEISSHDSL